MASLYKREGSTYWWIKYQDGARIVRKTTKYRHDVIADTRRAQIEMHEHTVRELSHARADDRARWEAWVPQFIALRYANSPLSFKRNDLQWRNLMAYFEKKKIRYPHELTRQDCFNYMPWRIGKQDKNGTYEVEWNTARMELKFLHLVMDEAIQRRYATVNPAAKLGLKKKAPKVKPEFQPEHIPIIREALLAEPEWMQVAFDIGYHTGLRLRETNLPLPFVDVGRQSFAVPTAKGGKCFSALFVADLVPLFERLKAARGPDATCYDMPAMPSKDWWFFFRRIGLPQYCFHCLRVSFITRGARAGIPERIMMKLVNHASGTIHAIYLRLGVDDERQFMEQLNEANRKGAGPAKLAA